MEKQETNQADSNVVSLFNKKAAKDASATEVAPKAEESFEDVMTRNAKNRERMAKERANANKSVLRSYKIKN